MYHNAHVLAVAHLLYQNSPSHGTAFLDLQTVGKSLLPLFKHC